MSRSTPLIVSRPRVAAGLAAFALLLAVPAPVRAEEPAATVNVWSATGTGKVDSHTASSTPPGESSGSTNRALAQAIGCFSHGEGDACAAAADADVKLTACAQSKTSYQVSADNTGASESSWSATGIMNWEGWANVDSLLDGDADASATAMLGYSGDLVLTGAAAVAASTGSGEKQIEWKISLSPSYSQKYTRKKKTTSDSCASGARADSQGSGSAVHVDVVAFAQTDVAVDTNLFGFGYASASANATNRGTIDMSVTVTYDGSTVGGSGGQAGPDPIEGGPQTPGGGGGNIVVVTPRYSKTFGVRIEHSLPPVITEGDVRRSDELPGTMKTVSAPEPRTGEDTDGNIWSRGEGGE